MPNWTRNIIQIGQNVPQERFEAVMLKMLRRDSRKKSNAFVSAANARRACESNHVNFDFNALIPMPKDLDIESSSDSDKGVILYKAVLEFPEMMESRILDAITGCLHRGRLESLPPGVRRHCRTDFPQKGNFSHCGAGVGEAEGTCKGYAEDAEGLLLGVPLPSGDELFQGARGV